MRHLLICLLVLISASAALAHDDPSLSEFKARLTTLFTNHIAAVEKQFNKNVALPGFYAEALKRLDKINRRKDLYTCTSNTDAAFCRVIGGEIDDFNQWAQSKQQGIDREIRAAEQAFVSYAKEVAQWQTSRRYSFFMGLLQRELNEKLAAQTDNTALRAPEECEKQNHRQQVQGDQLAEFYHDGKIIACVLDATNAIYEHMETADQEHLRNFEKQVKPEVLSQIQGYSE